MQESKTREKILKKVRSALIEQTPNPFLNTDTEAEIFQLSNDDPEVILRIIFLQRTVVSFTAKISLILLKM